MSEKTYRGIYKPYAGQAENYPRLIGQATTIKRHVRAGCAVEKVRGMVPIKDTLTPKGKALLSMLLNTPLPVEKVTKSFADPRD